MKYKRLLCLLLLTMAAMLALAACGFGGSGSRESTAPETTAPLCTDHVFDEGTAFGPYCDSEGYTVYECRICYTKRIEPLAPVGHTYSDEWSSDEDHHFHAATCGCAMEMKDKALHTFDEGRVTREPTCVLYGIRTYTCTVCAATKEEAIKALPHTFSDEWVKNGFYHYRVPSCGCPYYVGEGYRHEYDEGVVTKEPTCAEMGWLTLTCLYCDATTGEHIPTVAHTYSEEWTSDKDYHWHDAVCGCEGERTTRQPHEYDEGTVTTPPTCVDTGVITYTCLDCGQQKDKTLSATRTHTYEAAIIKPTCTAAGYTLHTCTGCGATKKDTPTEMLDHSYEATVHPATCTERGYTLYACRGCGHRYKDSYTALLSHDYEAVVTEPTCTAAGYTTHICTACGDSYTDAPTEPLPHDYEAVVTEPTCAERGYTTYTCTVCGECYQDDYTERLPHQDSAVVTEPTCTERGYTTYTCSECSRWYRAHTTSALGHHYVDILCTRCGAKEYSIGLSYALSEDKSYYIIDGIGTCEDTELVLPHTHRGLPVCEIGISAFEGEVGITSVRFLAGEVQQKICSRAFAGCTSLADITLPVGLTVINSDAFLGCSALDAVRIDDLLAWCRINFGNPYANPLAYAHNLYDKGQLLTQLLIPEGALTEMGRYAFYGCTPLTKVEIRSGVNVLGVGIFGECTGLETLTVPVLPSHLGSLFGAADYTENAAYVPPSLAQVTVTGGLDVKAYAFYGCSSIKHLSLDGEISRIGKGVFEGCSALLTLKVPFLGGGSSPYLGYFFGADDHTGHAVCIPAGLWSLTVTGGESIGDYALADCAALTSVSLPTTLTAIGKFAFMNCQSLERVRIDGALESIGERIFLHCPRLGSLSLTGVSDRYFGAKGCIIDARTGWVVCGAGDCVLPTDGSVTGIASYAFAGNTVLETLELPPSIVYIGAYAFSGCTSLEGVKFNAYDNWHVSVFEDLAFPPSHHPSSDPAKNAEELTGYYGEWYWFVKDPYS